MGCGLSRSHSTLEALVSHRNARLTVHGRMLIVQRHRAGWKQAHIAAAMGVSRKCVRTWLDRYAAEQGGAALFAALALLIVFLRKRSRGRV